VLLKKPAKDKTIIKLNFWLNNSAYAISISFQEEEYDILLF